MSEKLQLRLGIIQEEFPLLFQFVSSERNQMRRTRKLCTIAENALRSQSNIAEVPSQLVVEPEANMSRGNFPSEGRSTEQREARGKKSSFAEGFEMF